MTAARQRAVAMARAAVRMLNKADDDIQAAYIENYLEEAAALDAYFANTRFVRVAAGQFIRLKPEPVDG